MSSTIELDDYARELQEFGVLSVTEIKEQLNRLSPFMLDMIIKDYEFRKEFGYGND